MVALTWLRGVLRRRPGRTIAVIAGVTAAVALLGSIGAFLAGARATMTRQAVANVVVDWQVEVQPGADPVAVLAAIQSRPEVHAALPVGFGSTPGLQATTGGTTQSTGAGVVLGLHDDYRTTFGREIRDLVGARTGVLIAQQTASNLRVRPGDTFSVGRLRGEAVPLRVDGVADLPLADALFQHVGAAPGAQPQAPPDNIVIVPLALWHSLFDDPADATAHQQVHVRTNRRLSADPVAAYEQSSRLARNVEARMAGKAIVGNNLAVALDAARKDALYATVLFVLLGLPGGALAVALTVSAAATGGRRRRRELSLLRARGASPSQQVRVALAEAVVVGVGGALAGALVTAVVGRAFFGNVLFGTAGGRWLWLAMGTLLAVVVAVVAVAGPVWRDARTLTVAEGRREVGALVRPSWSRFGLDLWLLAAAALLLWLSARGKYQLVLAPEGVPTVSVSYWALAGPLLAWLGAGLLAWRVVDAFLRRGRRITETVVRPVAGRLAGTVAASLSRQRRILARGLVLVALAIAFSASTAIFNTTFRHQVAVDARLTNGADVTVTESPGAAAPPAAAAALSRVSGVAHVEPLVHRFAYVGTDLQDLYGIRPATAVTGADLKNAYFVGNARRLVARLGARPDGVLVSAETAKDFQLREGDTLRLRLQDSATGALREIPFTYVGVVKEFPTAPRDSFLVTNANFVAEQTHSDSVGSFLVTTRGASPGVVASRVRSALGLGPTVTDIDSSHRIIGSSLSAVNLSGLTKIELGFGLVLVLASAGLVFGLGLAERRRIFAIMRALGARPRQVAALVWSEAIVLGFGGIVTGALVGWLVANILVRVLTGVFDPPPDHLWIPWSYVSFAGAVAVVSLLGAGQLALRAARRRVAETIREL